MSTPVYCAIPAPPYWNGWVLSACMHTVVVGAALFLAHQLPTPQKAERNPIAVAFVTPQPTHTTPTRRQTMKKSPPTPTLTPKQVQTDVIPREPTQSKPHTQTQPRQKVSPQTVVHASLKPAPLPKVQVTNAMPMSVAQPKTLKHTQATHQPTVSTGAISSQPATVAQRDSQPAVSSGVIASQPMSQHTDITRQHAALKVHGSPSLKKPIHVNPTIEKHERNVAQPIATHDEKRTRAQAMEVMKRQVARGKTHAPVKHVFSKPVHQPASLSSGSRVVRTRTTMSYTRQTKKSRPAPNARATTRDGYSPELLAFSKLLREKITRTLVFPRLAKRLGYSGTTHVALAFSKNGVVRNLQVSQPSGYEILDKAAIVTLEKVLQTTKPPESIEIEQLIIPIAFNIKRN